MSSTLIVDDDAVHGEMLVEVLLEAGWDASSTTGVSEAIVALHSGRYGVVVSDIRMEDGNGFDLLRVIRASSRPVPVILMSSFGTNVTGQHAMAAGAFAYLPKPFALDDLLELVTRAHGRG